MTPQTGIRQAPLFMGFSINRTLSYPGIEPGSLALQADSFPYEPSGKFIFNHVQNRGFCYYS